MKPSEFQTTIENQFDYICKVCLLYTSTAAHAAGLVDDTVDVANEYSKYPLDNYQLDFYVDSGWDWLPWNWLDGIGKQVMYGPVSYTHLFYLLYKIHIKP